jgi:hypothetical protein
VFERRTHDGKAKCDPAGEVEKIIKSPDPSEPEKAEISVEGADTLYQEIRIENSLTDENGNEVRLKKGAECGFSTRRRNRYTLCSAVHPRSRYLSVVLKEIERAKRENQSGRLEMTMVARFAKAASNPRLREKARSSALAPRLTAERYVPSRPRPIGAAERTR